MKRDLAASGVARADRARSGPSLLWTRSAHAIRTTLHAALESEDLMFEQWLVLSVLADQPGLRMSEIGEATVVPAASLTRHMDKLVERALVIRRIDAEDKRRAVCALSARGQDLVDRIRAVEASIEQTLIQAMGAAAYRQVLSRLEVAIDVLGGR